MNLQPYFESKLGQKIRVTRTTGHAFYTEVYRRQYELEVLAVDDGKVMFHVTSDDIVPRGYLHGGSDKPRWRPPRRRPSKRLTRSSSAATRR
jgi:hypothetical protein